jgi:hypothetical protein
MRARVQPFVERRQRRLEISAGPAEYVERRVNAVSGAERLCLLDRSHPKHVPELELART